MNCPCHSALPFGQCCQPLIEGRRASPTAEALMRSRYSAFATGAVDYLLLTSAPERHAVDEHEALQHSCAATRWLALHILDTAKGSEKDSVGEVEFAAFYETAEGLGQLHERSAFERRQEGWVYVGGQFKAPLTFGRNDPCWCYSGRKYKKCHGS